MAAYIRQPFARHDLYDIAKVHDRHLMGKGFNQSKVMADKADGNVLFPLQTGDKFNHRFLYGNVQRTGGFVHNDELRFQGNGTGDGHALPLTAGHVMGEPVRKIAGKLYQFQQFPRLRIYLRRADSVKIQQRFADDLLDLHLGIKRCGGILEHHLDMLTVLVQLLSLHLRDILPVEEDFAFCGAVKPYQKTHEGTLAAAGFTDQAQGLPFIEFQIDIIAGGKQAAVVSRKTAGHMTRVNQQIFFIKHSAYLLTSVPHPTAAWYTDWWTGGVYTPVPLYPQLRRAS